MDTLKYLVTGKYDHSDPAFQQGIKDYYESVYNSPAWAHVRKREAEEQAAREKQQYRDRLREAMDVPDFTDPVQQNDACAVYIDALNAAPRMQVQWAAMMKTKTETYIPIAFEDITRALQKGRLFIAESKLDEFKKFPQVDGKYVFAVNEAFQYFNSEGSGKDRFLVFHPKENRMYAFRLLAPFVSSDVSGTKEWQMRHSEFLKNF